MSSNAGMWVWSLVRKLRSHAWWPKHKTEIDKKQTIMIHTKNFWIQNHEKYIVTWSCYECCYQIIKYLNSEFSYKVIGRKRVLLHKFKSPIDHHFLPALVLMESYLHGLFTNIFYIHSGSLRESMIQIRLFHICLVDILIKTPHINING